MEPNYRLIGLDNKTRAAKNHPELELKASRILLIQNDASKRRFGCQAADFSIRL
jgi:hypothetical protein